MKRRPGRIASLALLLAAIGVLALAARAWGFGLARVSGASMSDTLRDGDVVLITRFDYLGGRAPGFGDIVECAFPGRGGVYIKRVIGLPGDAIAFSGGVLERNGSATPEPYVSSSTADYAAGLGEDEYLLLGDNRAQSYDSRMPDMGMVGSEAFLGRVRLIIWPLKRLGLVE